MIQTNGEVNPWFPTVEEAFFLHICKLEGNFQGAYRVIPTWSEMNMMLEGDGVYWDLCYGINGEIYIEKFHCPHASLRNLWEKLGYKREQN